RGVGRPLFRACKVSVSLSAVKFWKIWNFSRDDGLWNQGSTVSHFTGNPAYQDSRNHEGYSGDFLGLLLAPNLRIWICGRRGEAKIESRSGEGLQRTGASHGTRVFLEIRLQEGVFDGVFCRSRIIETNCDEIVHAIPDEDASATDAVIGGIVDCQGIAEFAYSVQACLHGTGPRRIVIRPSLVGVLLNGRKHHE